MNVIGVARRAAIAMAAAVLAGAYVAMALYTSTPWLWSTIVHESGDRTLLQTVLYYEHAARELPLDVLLGVAVAGGALFVIPAGGFPRRRHVRYLAALAAVIGVILAGALWTGGSRTLYENLLQLPTRPGAPLVWGGHWRYHLLSELSLLLLSFGMAAPLLAATGARSGNRQGLSIFAVALALFVGLTVLFVPSDESVRDPAFVGHQAREVFTHTLMTIPLAWGVCLSLAPREGNGTRSGTAPLTSAFVAGAAGAIIAIFLALRSLATSAVAHGQSDSVAVLIFPHFYEHTFSYIVTTLTAAAVFESGAMRTSGGTARRWNPQPSTT